MKDTYVDGKKLARNGRKMATYYAASFLPHYRRVLFLHLLVFNLCVSILISGIDYINSVCPCAGLSMLNRSKGAGVGRGSDAEANKWMFKSAEYVLGKIKPKVVWGENAPLLFTKTGQGVVDGLR